VVVQVLEAKGEAVTKAVVRGGVESFSDKVHKMACYCGGLVGWWQQGVVGALQEGFL